MGIASGHSGPADPRDRFGELVRGRRVAVGLTQEELAERSGLGVRTISDIERGRIGLPAPPVGGSALRRARTGPAGPRPGRARAGRRRGPGGNRPRPERCPAGAASTGAGPGGAAAGDTAPTARSRPGLRGPRRGTEALAGLLDAVGGAAIRRRSRRSAGAPGSARRRSPCTGRTRGRHFPDGQLYVEPARLRPVGHAGGAGEGDPRVPRRARMPAGASRRARTPRRPCTAA